jgi:hypothetical protein
MFAQLPPGRDLIPRKPIFNEKISQSRGVIVEIRVVLLLRNDGFVFRNGFCAGQAAVNSC